MPYAYYQTPVGLLQLGYQDNTLTSLRPWDGATTDHTPTAFTQTVADQLTAYCQGQRTVFDISLAPHGTPFQQAVWHALQTIPYGQTRTYGQIATAIGNPKAARAVGMANNRNPLMIVIPCHRVVGAKGDLVGYAGGLSMKQWLLDLERGKKNK